ncbi:signal peptidase II [Alicyclobacillus sp. SO9]|uniref:signal peptidase II n=1 Tax=Alicyclobacillus sp. SO9 TaxID=2665646 RepID=UPI0018E886AC|nr:signal peptidase II [Alicyclobacillus sp. SO9]QQE78291.1 signal peptidase II [Alicyclobacillus sp. SO9]
MGTLNNHVRRAKGIGIVLGLIVFAVDRTIKILINRGDISGRYGIVQIIPLHNYGAMGGTLAHHRLLLTGIGLAVIVGLSIMWFRYAAGRYPILFYIGWGFLFGGALGNTFGRLFYGYVTDMFHLPHGRGVFNLADISLQLGILLMALHYVLQPRSVKHHRN